MFDAIRWEDNFRASLPVGVVGTADADGVTHLYTISAILEDDAADHEAEGNLAGLVCATALRETAAEARILGLRTEAAYLSHAGR